MLIFTNEILSVQFYVEAKVYIWKEISKLYLPTEYTYTYIVFIQVAEILDLIATQTWEKKTFHEF